MSTASCEDRSAADSLHRPEVPLKCEIGLPCAEISVDSGARAIIRSG
jgi:hypothetical protein